MSDTLYARLGGYDAIAAVADNLFKRVRADEQIGRFWAHRGEDGIAREKQFVIDYLSHNAGGPVYYTGRDMKTAHVGMGLSLADWDALMGHIRGALEDFDVPESDIEEVMGFLATSKDDVLEA